MTVHPRHAFNVAPGEAQPTLRALIFRRVMATWRKRPGPEGWSPPGAGAPGRPFDERHCAFPSVHGMTGPYYCTRPLHHYPLPESEAMTTGEFAALDERVDAVLRRPVNGRSLPDQPRRHPGTEPVPAYGTAPVAVVLAAELQAARDLDRQARAEAGRAWYVRSQMPSGTGAPAPAVLGRVAAVLRRQVEDSGVSVDCWNGCHAPLCSGCGCECHR